MRLHKIGLGRPTLIVKWSSIYFYEISFPDMAESLNYCYLYKTAQKWNEKVICKCYTQIYFLYIGAVIYMIGSQS